MSVDLEKQKDDGPQKRPRLDGDNGSISPPAPIRPVSAVEKSERPSVTGFIICSDIRCGKKVPLNHVKKKYRISAENAKYFFCKDCLNPKKKDPEKIG